MKKKQILLVQGDVFLTKISRLPIKTIKVEPEKKRGFILAKSEATGHAHRIIDINAFMFIDINLNRYIRNKKEIKIVHEEHKPLIVPEGIWKVGIVREFDPFLNSERSIED